jgi:hypothetical protein
MIARFPPLRGGLEAVEKSLFRLIYRLRPTRVIMDSAAT